MDTFNRIAEIFKADCKERLKLLEDVHFVFENSETTAKAAQILFTHSHFYTDDIAEINAIPVNITRLKNCIDCTEVGEIHVHVQGFRL